MTSREELLLKGIEYEETRWNWMTPGYPVTTSDFTTNGDYEVYTFKEFCILWADRLNEEEDTDKYFVCYNRGKDREVKRLTVVKLKEVPVV